MREVSFGTISPQEVESYKSCLNIVEPLFPLSWWNDKQTYFEMKYSHTTEYKEYFDATDTCIRYLKHKTFDPINAALQCKSTQAQSKDLDKGQIEFTDANVFLNYNERHALELSDPFVYGEYTIKKDFGCQHHLRGAQPYCDICQKSFGCDICHNDEVLDHELNWKDVKKVVCCNCNKLQDINHKCKYCWFKMSNSFCHVCKEIITLDPETEPCYHCQKCNKCHRNAIEKLCVTCPECNECYAPKNANDHICSNQEVNCIVCQGQITHNTDFVTLICSEKHKIHESCLQQLYNNNQGHSCPVCRKSLLDSLTTQKQQMTVVEFIVNQKPDLSSHKVNIFKCKDCNILQADLNYFCCRHCWLQNVDEIADVVLTSKQFKCLLQGQKIEDNVQYQNEINQFGEDLQTYKEVFSPIHSKASRFLNIELKHGVWIMIWLCAIAYALQYISKR
ncbi:CHY_zinc finger domain-containing protein [Hexamita inflata]|uniref:CHY zinc finger domain-containing protein n=1 Tax=Hexamita inflata TaxID=28002 RepID=A0AA86TT00_9EUKA|nr:CHY zinc finger domain-containing protein [Hexamita inflata]